MLQEEVEQGRQQAMEIEKRAIRVQEGAQQSSRLLPKFQRLFKPSWKNP